MHAGMQVRKTKEKPVRSKYLEFSYCGRTSQNSLWILFLNAPHSLIETKQLPREMDS